MGSLPGPRSAQASDVVIRHATGDDLDAVVDVGRRTWPATYESIFEEGLVGLFLDKKWTKQALIPSIRSGRTLVAEVAGRVVGMASYSSHEAALALWRLYVLPEAQGHGVGARLLSEVMSHAGAVGRELHIPFTDGNAAAYRFACAHGFTRVRREPQGEMPDLIWMSRPGEGVADNADGTDGTDNADGTDGTDGTDNAGNFDIAEDTDAGPGSPRGQAP